jgi:hypothetical protein
MMTKLTKCGYCGAEIAVDDAYAHLAAHMHERIPIVSVYNMRAALVRQVPVSPFRAEFEIADPQPPERMLIAAVHRAGGALNISGFYPVSPALARWIARRAPEWRSLSANRREEA